MVEIKWTIKSINDLKSIFEYITQDSKKYANLQIKKIKERTKQLKIQPLSGRIVPEFDESNIRELIEGNFRIVYLINEPKYSY